MHTSSCYRVKCVSQSCCGEALCSVYKRTAATAAAAAAAIFSVWVLSGPDQPSRSWRLHRDSTTTTGAGTHRALNNSMGGGGNLMQ